MDLAIQQPVLVEAVVVVMPIKMETDLTELQTLAVAVVHQVVVLILRTTVVLVDLEL
jgi:hypothetical protein